MKLVIEAKTHAGGAWGRLSSLGEINEQLHAAGPRRIDEEAALTLAGREIARWRATITDAHRDIQLRVTDLDAPAVLREAA